MDSSKLKVIFILTIAAVTALYLGIAAATNQFEAIGWMLAFLGLATVLVLGRHVWAIIPATMVLGGNIGLLPGAPAPWWGAVAVTAGMTSLHILMQKRYYVVRINWIDFAILLQVAAIAQALLRNPAGFSVLGGDVVGGKPYITFGFAIVGYLLISTAKTNINIIRWVIIAMIAIGICDGALALLSVFFPMIGIAILPIYSGVNFHAALAGENTFKDSSSNRLAGSRELGTALCVPAFTLHRPLSCLNPIKPLRFLMISIGLTAILLSGFRQALFYVAVVAIASTIIRKKTMDCLIMGCIGFTLLALLIVTGTTEKLPFGAQRALSVLPIKVREDAREDALESAEWRFEMWKLALSTDRYIKNKFLGDGFAMRADELAILQSVALGTGYNRSREEAQELMMAKGSYHGFHVETIRMTGYFGLACALAGLVIFMRYAWLQIKHFRGHRYWGYILYLCIPFLLHPFYMMLIFGTYRIEFPLILMGAGLLKMIDNIRVREIADITNKKLTGDSHVDPQIEEEVK